MLDCSREPRRGFDAVAETPKFPDHLRGAALGARFGDRWSAFLVDDAVVQDLPHEPTEPMRNRPNRLGVSEADDEPAIHELKDTAFGLHRGVRGLIEEATHLPIAVRRSMAVVDARALVVPGTGAHPGGQALGRREGGGRRADFGDDLLRGIDPEARYGREPLHGILMHAEQPRQFLIQLSDVRLDQISNSSSVIARSRR